MLSINIARRGQQLFFFLSVATGQIITWNVKQCTYAVVMNAASVRALRFFLLQSLSRDVVMLISCWLMIMLLSVHTSSICWEQVIHKKVSIIKRKLFYHCGRR